MSRRCRGGLLHRLLVMLLGHRGRRFMLMRFRGCLLDSENTRQCDCYRKNAFLHLVSPYKGELHIAGDAEFNRSPRRDGLLRFAHPYCWQPFNAALIKHCRDSPAGN